MPNPSRMQITNRRGKAAKQPHTCLDRVRIGTKYEARDVAKILNELTPRKTLRRDVDEHWDKVAGMFLVGVVLYSIYQAKTKGGVPSLSDASWALTSPEGIDRLYVNMKENTCGDGQTPHRIIQGAAIDVLELDERGRSEVLARAKAQLYGFRVGRE